MCRYSQTLLSSHPPASGSRSAPVPFSDPTSTPQSRCSECSSSTNLWICLICGNVGCGRYGRAHAHSHYESTTHLYALELETQRVWDYAGDGYVHRLIQNRADGKLVELPSASTSLGGPPRDGDSGPGPGPADALSAEKIEAIGIEYSYLLTSQLDSQRSYYEEQTAEMKEELSQMKIMVQQLSEQFEREKVATVEREKEAKQENERQLSETAKDKLKAEARAVKLADLARKLERELKEERAVNGGIVSNMKAAKGKVEALEEEKKELAHKITDLEDQLRDLMFFLEANSKIERGGGMVGELAGGSVELPSASSVDGAQSVKKKQRKGR